MAKYFIVNGVCSTRKTPVGYQFKVGDDGNYYAVGSLRLSGPSTDSGSSTETHTGKFLTGLGFKCRECGNDNFSTCGKCGTMFCIQSGAPTVTCPTCGNVISITWVDSIDEVSESSSKSSKQ